MTGLTKTVDVLSCLWDDAYKRTLTANQTEELAKLSTCARDRHALQQLALNVHIKHYLQLQLQLKRVAHVVTVGYSPAI